MLGKNHKSIAIFSTILVVILLLGGVLMFLVSKKKEITYTNPVGGMTNIGDPFVLKEGDKYYMYATSDVASGFRAWESDNMVDWEERGTAYNIGEQSDQWAIGDFWAPEVIKYNNQFYMTYSARNSGDHLRISIAASQSPLGPFEDVSIDIIEQEGSFIDGHIFIEDDGTPYLYYVKDCSENIIDGKHVSQIFVQKMAGNLTSLLDEPKLLLEPDQEWEGLKGEYRWNEGPFVIKHDNKYYLMYSSNYYASEDYSVGYAVANNPMGPFVKAMENPILSKDLKNGISGPGHNSVTVGPDGKTFYAVYHIHTFPENPSGDRQMSIDRIYFKGEKLKIAGPSYTEQKIILKGK